MLGFIFEITRQTKNAVEQTLFRVTMTSRDDVFQNASSKEKAGCSEMCAIRRAAKSDTGANR